MTVSSVGHKPDGQWSFDASVASVFDDMLARSIPQYRVMRDAVTELASVYVQPNTWIVDLGCSRGESLAPLIERFGPANLYLGCDVSEPMLQAARERFEPISESRVCIERRDLRLANEYPDVEASVTLSILTLQFTPIEYRQQIVSRVYKHLCPGGIFIMVEKILGETAELDSRYVERYYAMKAANGYSADDIERKRLSLEGVLVPVTADWNFQLLERAGFSQVGCFWRWMNFAGWLAIKAAQ